MKYKFEIECNVHMYNHIIKCKYNDKIYKAICESAPKEEETILIWPADFGFPEKQMNELTDELKKWAKTQSFKCIICSGNRVNN